MSEERKALREKLLSQRKNGYDRIKPEELQAIDRVYPKPTHKEYLDMQ